MAVYYCGVIYMAMMHPGQAALENDVMDWVLKNPDAKTIPAHLEGKLERINRYNELAHADKKDFLIRQDPYERERIQAEILATLEDYTTRRQMEQDLAVYIDQVATSQLKYELYDIAERLNNCRHTGAAGIKPDGNPVIAWDTKCGLSKLCPDESREVTQRLTEFYLPELVDFKKENISHRIYYSVFTIPNIQPGELRAGKKEIIERFKSWSEKIPSLKGSLIIQEDPLSAAGDWNVHLNIFLCVKGSFDYKTARAQWGYDVEFNELKGEPQDIRDALLEAIKYSAEIAPTKTESKADQDKTKAPAMTQWPHELFVEWWNANKRFRRVRNYGCLYNIHKKRWNSAGYDSRKKFIKIANETATKQEQIISGGTAWNSWQEITSDHKTRLRRAMTHGEPFDISLVQWVGAVNFDSDGVYSVGSVLGDKFFNTTATRSTSFDFYNDFRGGG